MPDRLDAAGGQTLEIKLMDDPKLVDRREAARILGLKESTLRRWWSAGRGPAGVKLSTARSGRVLYRVEELLRWSADPASYSRPARPATLPTYAPPRRRGGGSGEIRH
jgi:hypothetical protein